jgi:hypothetical protein
LTDSDDTQNETQGENGPAPPKTPVGESARNAAIVVHHHFNYVVDTLNWLSPVLTAVAKGLLVWAAIWQWIELHSTDGTLRETLRAQIKSSELQLRAYIGMDSKAFELHCESCDPPTPPKIEKVGAFHRGNFIAVTIRNSGQTPATEAFVHGSWKEMPFGASLPHDFTYPNVEANEPDDRSLVNPGDSIPGSHDLSIETIRMMSRPQPGQAHASREESSAR